MKEGTLVVMSEVLKDELRQGGSIEHLVEFGECIGRVDGLVDYGCENGAEGKAVERPGNDDGNPRDQLGPEIDVRWLPSRLRYAYHPDHLRIVSMIIAVDGPAASGKGTLARRIGEHFGLHYLDTGSLYRACARDAQVMNVDLKDTAAVVKIARGLDPEFLNDVGLRAPGVGEGASIVAQIPQVRAALLDYQRNFATRHPGAVLDGRDIGTVVCPDADVKLFVNASVEVRAWRRFLERQSAGESVTFDDVLGQIIERDERDTNRGAAPMQISSSADLLDTSQMDISQAFDAAVGLILRKVGQKGAR